MSLNHFCLKENASKEASLDQEYEIPSKLKLLVNNLNKENKN